MLHPKSFFSGLIQVANPMHPDALVERCLPSSNLKSNFSRLFERSADVLALYSIFHSLLLLGGLLNNLGLSFMTR